MCISEIINKRQVLVSGKCDVLCKNYAAAVYVPLTLALDASFSGLARFVSCFRLRNVEKFCVCGRFYICFHIYTLLFAHPISIE